jgi:hypothetical protein
MIEAVEDIIHSAEREVTQTIPIEDLNSSNDE